MGGLLFTSFVFLGYYAKIGPCSGLLWHSCTVVLFMEEQTCWKKQINKLTCWNIADLWNDEFCGIAVFGQRGRNAALPCLHEHAPVIYVFW